MSGATVAHCDLVYCFNPKLDFQWVCRISSFAGGGLGARKHVAKC